MFYIYVKFYNCITFKVSNAWLRCHF
ncbi:hypothetical protein Bhyg_13062 [Pseudolycoriella hygida]|uniref:Uncharacterized protein n=1 Tax=Pseudolycoriella hygida TaxID=35572 RepID=A0A9Q0MYN4_9DIPT|nr:hypothetical protein Bhyg_13062 [Pseudolycoriella hygida]